MSVSRSPVFFGRKLDVVTILGCVILRVCRQGVHFIESMCGGGVRPPPVFF